MIIYYDILDLTGGKKMNKELILVNGELTTLRDLFEKYELGGTKNDKFRSGLRERLRTEVGEWVQYINGKRLVIERYDGTELEREIVELIAKLDSTRSYDPVGEERLEELMRRYLRER